MPTPINQSIVHGFELLAAVLKAKGPCGSRQLSRDLGMAQAKVVRLTTTLCSLGLLRRTAAGKYRPGPGLHVLAGQALVGSGLVAAALPDLQRLHAAGWTVALGVLWQQEVCYLVHARQHQELIERIGMHHLYPAAESSLGRMLLAHLQADSLGQETSTGIRTRGHERVTFSNGEVSIAVAIGDPIVAALGVSRQAITAAEAKAIIAELHDIAANISERLQADDQDVQT